MLLVNPAISGPTKFCPSGTMKVNPLPAGTITWSVSPSNALSFIQGNASTTFTRIGSFSGQATITVTLNPSCGTTEVLTKSIIVGSSITMSWNGTGPYGQVDVNVQGGIAPYKFYRNSVLIYTSYSASTTIPFGCNGGLLKAEASTQCGTASVSDIVPAGCASFMYLVYPNPSSFDVFVTSNTQNEKYLTSIGSSVNSEVLDGSTILELYDFSGNMVRRHTFNGKNKNLKINVSNLKKGIYFLKIIAREMEETHHIVVE